MIFLKELALYVWTPIVLVMFMTMRPRTALLTAYVGGWLFLPVAGIALPGFPDLTKSSVVSFAAIVSVLAMDPTSLMRFRFRWFDIPVLVWMVAPSISAMTNGLGAWDMLSAGFQQVLLWGVPYYLGRVYFNDPDGWRALAKAILIGGLIYAPLCLFEMRMSPQLHRFVYGNHPTAFHMAIRLGGFRPMMFMQHGVMVAMFMMMAALSAYWFWQSRSLQKLWGVPMAWIAIGLIAVTLLCRSLSVIVLVVALLPTMWLVSRQRMWWLLIGLVAIVPTYITARTVGGWDGQNLVRAVQTIADYERASSLDFRMRSEDALAKRALERPFFGWRGWGRNLVSVPGVTIITDGLWIIILGQNGLVGLTAMFCMILIPSIIVWYRIPPKLWLTPALGSPFVLSLFPVLFSIDALPNAFVNPLYILCAGSVSALAAVAKTVPTMQTRARVVPSSTPGEGLRRSPRPQPA